MLKMISLRFSFSSRGVTRNLLKRCFLSNAYKCEEAWANRLKNPAFRKTDSSVLYHELDLCFQYKTRVSVLDIDLLINGLKDDSYKSELDDVLLRVRLCPECVLLPERATHAAIRWYLRHASTEEVMNVLSDRMNYGLFPGYYLTNVMMDNYLKKNDSRSAVKVAVLQMLQEELDHPITKALALYSCYNYLESPDIWESYKEPEPDPDEEVTKIRVKYIRNPYFDDHFDITDTNHLVGKTLWLFGRTVDGAMGTSSELLGLILYEKYEKCAGLLDEVIRKESKIYSEALEKAKQYALKKPKQVGVAEESEVTKVEGTGEKTEAQEKEGGRKESEPLDEWKIKVLELMERINKQNLVSGNLLSESEQLVKKAVEMNESNDIKHQCQVYKQWEKDREDAIQNEIERARLIKIRKEIEETKAELEKEEKKVFFFDREEEIQQIVKEKEEEKEKVVFYKGKGKHREKDLSDFIPPDVTKRRS